MRIFTFISNILIWLGLVVPLHVFCSIKQHLRAIVKTLDSKCFISSKLEYSKDENKFLL